MEFSSRVAVITGGESGIGASIASRLRAEAAVVVTWDLKPGADVLCDVADATSVATAMRETIARWGVPTIIVAAAGIPGRPGPIQDSLSADFDRVMAVNLRGVFLTVREGARALRESGEGGSFVAVSSVNGIIADAGHAAYSASKAGVIQLCRIAASDLGHLGIRVNAIAPGPTSTPILGDRATDAAYLEDVAAVTPLGHIGSPELVADAVVNILRSDWISGAVVPVDGGESLTSARGQWRLPRAESTARYRAAWTGYETSHDED